MKAKLHAVHAELATEQNTHAATRAAAAAESAATVQREEALATACATREASLTAELDAARKAHAVVSTEADAQRARGDALLVRADTSDVAAESSKRALSRLQRLHSTLEATAAAANDKLTHVSNALATSTQGMPLLLSPVKFFLKIKLFIFWIL